MMWPHRERDPKLPQPDLVSATIPPELRQDAVFILEGPDARVRYVNQAGKSLFAFGQKKVLGRPLAELLEGMKYFADNSTVLLPQEEWPANRVLRGERLEGIPITRIDPDGHTRRLVVSGEPLLEAPGLSAGALMIVRDVTPILRAEQAIERVFQTAGLGTMTLDLEGRITQVNSVSAAMLGMSEADLVGRSFITLVHPEDLHLAYKLAEGLKSGSAEALSTMLRLPHQSGKLLHIRKVETLQRDRDGRPLSFLCLLEDVTAAWEAETRLKQSEADLAEAQRIAHLGNWTWNLKTDRGVWSEELARLHELPAEVREGRRDALFQKVHPDDRLRVEAEVKRAVEQAGSFSFNYRVQLPSGRMRIYHTEGHTVARHGEPTEVFGITQDVTENQELKDRLQLEQEHLRDVQRLGRLIYFDWDIPNDRFYPAPEAIEMLGLDAGWSGQSIERFFTLIHPDDLAHARAAVETALATGKPYEVEFRARQSDGHYLTFLLRGHIQRDAHHRPTRLSGAAIDLTARREAEETLRQRESDLAEAQRLAQLGNWTWDLETGIIDRSPEVSRIFGNGTVPVQATLEDFLSIVHVEDRGAVEAAFRRVLQTREPFEIEHRIVVPSGAIRYVQERGRLISGADGHPLRVFGTTQDVTESRQVEHLKGEFLSIVSHELRTPLTTIGAPLSMLKEQIPDHPESQLLFDIVLRSVQRMRRLVEDTLDMDRLIHGRMEVHLASTGIPALVTQVIEEMQPLAINHGVRLETARLEGVALCDPIRISQVLTNLLNNAIAFSPSGAAVTLSAEVVGDEVRVSVQDRGRGIPPELQTVIFEPFRQAEPAATRRKGGTGLGLAVARAILDQHHGRIWVDSEPEHGSTFHFTLPLAKREAGEA